MKIRRILTIVCVRQSSPTFGHAFLQPIDEATKEAVDDICNQDGNEQQSEPANDAGRWKPGQDYPAAPPITPNWTKELPHQMARGVARERDRTTLGFAHGACSWESSQHRKAGEQSPFTSPSLVHSRAPSVTPHRAATSPLLQPSQPSPRGQRAVDQYDATPPDFGLRADVFYNTVNTHWDSFVQRSFAASPSPLDGTDAQHTPTVHRPESPMHEQAYPPVTQRASSPMMLRAASPRMQRSAPPLPVPVPTAPNQGNDKNSVLSHPLLEQQYAHFLDEQRKKGELRGADVSRALRIGGKSDDGAEGMGPPGTPVLSGVTGGLAGEGLSPENAHVIAREIARLQASRAEDAERLKALMQRKGG